MDATEIKAKPAPARTFRLVDMLMLVAATAVGFWLSGALFGSDDSSELSWTSIQEAWTGIFDPAPISRGNAGPSEVALHVLVAVSQTIAACVPMFVAWTVTVLLIRLFGPRPTMRRLSRQPGFAAILASTVPLLLIPVSCVFVGLAYGWESLADSTYIDLVAVLALPTLAGVGVLAAWSSLLISGRRRPEASWIDRLGRVLGICWVVAGLNSSTILWEAGFNGGRTCCSARSVKTPEVPTPPVVLPPFVEKSRRGVGPGLLRERQGQARYESGPRGRGPVIDLRPLGDRAFLARFLDSGDARRWADAVRDRGWRGVVEVTVAYASAAVFVDPDRVDPTDLEPLLRQVEPILGETPTGRLIHLPVLYDGEDLGEVATRVGLKEAEIVARHAGQDYSVFAIGFLPGFPYSGYLPTPLSGLPRRSSPRSRVPAGSVAIAGRQTGVYPAESPGGWHLLGRTPCRIVDLARGHFPIKAGDRLRFVPIDEAEFWSRRGESLDLAGNRTGHPSAS